ncbi:18568_t:CDS:2, partial [Gigaspora margarita]
MGSKGKNAISKDLSSVKGYGISSECSIFNEDCLYLIDSLILLKIITEKIEIKYFKEATSLSYSSSLVGLKENALDFVTTLNWKLLIKAIDNDTEILKDITNITSLLRDTNVGETQTELSAKKKDTISINKEKVQTGSGSLSKNCFYKNIDNMLELPEQKTTSWNSNEGDNKIFEDNTNYIAKKRIWSSLFSKLKRERTPLSFFSFIYLTSRKPNSTLRKCARVVLSNGMEVTVFIPGEEHNLQEFSNFLIQGGGAKYLSRINFSVVCGTKDTEGVKNRKQDRSLYGKKKEAP